MAAWFECCLADAAAVGPYFAIGVDLIDQQALSWPACLVDSVFLPEDAALIKWIPLSVHCTQYVFI